MKYKTKNIDLTTIENLNFKITLITLIGTFFIYNKIY